MKKVYSASSNVWSYDYHQTQLNFEGTQCADDDVDDCFVAMFSTDDDVDDCFVDNV